ncbi:RluA family pseudouridine synthase [bacterium]|nr:RluA family pseudouridine synthase [bacterium]
MEININPQQKGERVDKIVVEHLEKLGFRQVSRNMIKDDISLGTTVNMEKAKPSYRLKVGDVLSIEESFWKKFFANKNLSEEILPEEGDLDILYEDEHLLVLCKPKGLVVHPGVGNMDGTLANYLKHYLQSKDEFDINMDRAGIVHRLDRGVSGIMVVAKTKEVQDLLKEQFANREVDKLYLATVEKFKDTQLEVIEDMSVEEVVECLKCGGLNYSAWFDARGYIGRDRVNRYKMAFKLYEFSGSKKAQSYLLPISKDKILVKIVTGRMHQIRATLAYYGYHILGDVLYNSGSREVSSPDIMLQSIYLSFVHPITKERLHFDKF